MERRRCAVFGTAMLAPGVLVVLAACSGGGPTLATASPEPSPAQSARATSAPAAAPTVSPASSPIASPTVAAARAASPTPTAIPTAALTPAPTAAPTPTPAPPPTPTPKVFAVVVDPAAPRTSQDIVITVMGLNADETFTIEVTPSGYAPYPRSYQADARGEWRTRTPANSWAGRSSFEVKATRASTGQVIQKTYPLSP